MRKTANQIEHHAEQMEAARRDFEQLWQDKIKPASFSLDMHLRLSDQDYAFMQHLCWNAFVEGRGL